MIITQDVEKVKRKVQRLVDKRSSHFTVPESKFILEMVMGMLMTGDR